MSLTIGEVSNGYKIVRRCGGKHTHSQSEGKTQGSIYCFLKAISSILGGYYLNIEGFIVSFHICYHSKEHQS